MRNFLGAAIAMGLCACTSANAVTIDPKNDVHCSVLAFYFHGLAKHIDAPDEQVRATRGLQDWYARKMRSAEGGRYSNPAVMQSEIGPIFETIKSNPLSMQDEAKACADRASTDPEFNKFARSYMHP
ncbi:hypothetical protein [Sphingomonas sp. GB1N7]|uniref:hypothetical protein n=1 Tax=Parasphingomonas caseinilytica TaxID=3096158 RepID=UPI002FC94BE1